MVRNGYERYGDPVAAGRSCNPLLTAPMRHCPKLEGLTFLRIIEYWVR